MKKNRKFYTKKFQVGDLRICVGTVKSDPSIVVLDFLDYSTWKRRWWALDRDTALWLGSSLQMAAESLPKKKGKKA